MNYYRNFIFIINGPDKKLFLLILKFLCLAALELFSVSIFPLFINIIVSESGQFFLFKSFELGKENVFYLISAIFILKNLLTIYFFNSIFNYCEYILLDLRLRLINSFLSMPYIVFTSKNSSTLINTSILLAAKFSNGVLLNIVKLFSESLIALILFSYLIYSQGVYIILLLIVIALITLAYNFYLRPKIINYGAEANNSSKLMVKSIQETISGYKEIKTLNLNNYFINKFIECAEKYHSSISKSNLILVSPRYIIESVLLIFLFLIFYSGGSSEESLTNLGVFILCGLRLLPSYNVIQNSILQLSMNKSTINDLAGALSTKTNTDNVNHGIHPDFDLIHFDKISFRYDNSSDYLINNLSFTIRNGSINIIDGASGRGKTTLVNMLIGLLEPTMGRIYLSKNSKVVGGPSEIREISFYLPQDTFVIDETILENITFSSRQHTDDDLKRVWEACSLAKIDDFIRSLPLGLKTKIGDRGVQISGGQRQRIAIARALYFGRKIFILDESTSAIDIDTENMILNNLLELNENITIILITHRLNILHDKSIRITL